MQIYFSSIALPKKAAKRIQKHFSPEPETIFPHMPLHEAQRIAALMLGYKDWHELEQSTNSAKNTPSPLDEQASEEEQSQRLRYQANVLGTLLPLTEPILYELALKFRVSAGAPFSSQFAYDSHRQNKLFYWEPYGEPPEWRFRPSARSEETREELYSLIDKWGSGQLNFGEYLFRLDEIIEAQPENITPYLYIIEAIADIGEWEIAKTLLPELEAEIIKSIPANYPMKRKVPALNWGTIDNRDYLRSLYHLAQGYYANGNYKKAKQWFLFLTRCSEFEIGFEKCFLVDLRRATPDGEVHLMEGKKLHDQY
ncbi:hypothetical protein [Dasania marina]|uniref:hypothetical protein n=1 Tax=Dasania marina TaxID=471499 RepID=UPI0030DAEE9A|tara:strand:- start:2286 stop:3218 length:933 start_codon:yes stop_codon:yes gene_type:complete